MCQWTRIVYHIRNGIVNSIVFPQESTIRAVKDRCPAELCERKGVEIIEANAGVEPLHMVVQGVLWEYGRSERRGCLLCAAFLVVFFAKSCMWHTILLSIFVR